MNILVINGHPDAGDSHLVNALAAAYVAGAESAGHRVEMLNVAQLDFPLLRSRQVWEQTSPCEAILLAQLCIQRAQHIVLLYPLWLGGMPALLKGFLEQVLRPGFAFAASEASGPFDRKLLGKTARIVVTMGMPAFIYRWYYGAHSLKSLKRNILAFCGIGPVRSTLIGTVESPKPNRRLKALSLLRKLGQRGH